MSGKQGPPDDYIEVSERWEKARAEYPEARLQGTYEVIRIGEAWFIAYTARAYRSPDDPMPGVGTAYEPVPGKTPFTRDSELQNAETSAWGRALVAAGMADARDGIASANEVRNRTTGAEREPGEVRSAPVTRKVAAPDPSDLRAFRAAVTKLPVGDTDRLRHDIVYRATNGRTASSTEITKAELVDCWAEYRVAAQALGGGQEGGAAEDGG